MFTLFCPTCSAYFPSGQRCGRCGHGRAPATIPTQPGKPIWRQEIAGSLSNHLSLATIAGERGVLAAWSGAAHPRSEAGAGQGGMALIQLDTGQLRWRQSLPQPVEGGAAVAEGEGLVVAGLGGRSPGAGEGSLVALDLDSGAVKWRQRLGGAVRSAPVAEGLRVLAAACDGCAYALDMHTGQIIWRTAVTADGTPILASPLVIKDRGIIQAIIIATYGASQARDQGKIIALDENGRKLWEQPAGGNVRGTPVIAQELLYVTAFRSGPSAGIINSFDARTGRPSWPRPFQVQGQPSDRTLFYFSAAPLWRQGVLYVGCLNSQAFALEAATGRVLWDSRRNIGGPIATTPVWVEGLVVFGANDGKLVALDAESGEKAWEHTVGAPVQTNPVVLEDIILCGTAAPGVVTAVPWHNGLYGWAANRLEYIGRLDAAGDCRALSAHFSFQPEVRERDYQQAANDWALVGEPEKAAWMWSAFDNDAKVAETYRDAGERWRMHDPTRAAQYFERAAEVFYRLRQHHALNDCTRALATCAQLPYIRLQAVNVGSFIQWEQGELTLRLTNEGSQPVFHGVKLWMGGALKSAQEAQIQATLQPGQIWNIPLTLAPTRHQSVLEVEIEYSPGAFARAPMRAMISVPIEAVEPPQKPLQIGDIGVLQLTIAGATAEGLSIVTRDVGMMRSQTGAGSIQVSGDVGAISAH